MGDEENASSQNSKLDPISISLHRLGEKLKCVPAQLPDDSQSRKAANHRKRICCQGETDAASCTDSISMFMIARTPTCTGLTFGILKSRGAEARSSTCQTNSPQACEVRGRFRRCARLPDCYGQSLCNTLGGGGPSMQGIALRYSYMARMSCSVMF